MESTDLVELSVDSADEGDGMPVGGGDSDRGDPCACPREGRLAPHRVCAVDRMIHVRLTTVRVVDRERLNTARAHTHTHTQTRKYIVSE